MATRSSLPRCSTVSLWTSFARLGRWPPGSRLTLAMRKRAARQPWLSSLVPSISAVGIRRVPQLL